MKRQELLNNAKPILFNTEMVGAILDNRKTVTRRILKNADDYINCDCVENSFQFDEAAHAFYCNKCGYPLMSSREFSKPLYYSGDILYVRETWSPVYARPQRYLYKTHCSEAENLPVRWHPSIHMPKEAARIFLCVKDVRVERLQDITEDAVCKEGAEPLISCKHEHTVYYPDGGLEACFNTGCCSYCPALEETYAELFGKLVWNKTIKAIDKNIYGWDANPWVWVIEFERIEAEN